MSLPLKTKSRASAKSSSSLRITPDQRATLKARVELIVGAVDASQTEVPAYTKVRIEEHGDVALHFIQYRLAAGDEVGACIIIPKTLKKRQKVATVLCLHQTNRTGYLETIGMKEDAHFAYGIELARNGFVTFCPNHDISRTALKRQMKLGYPGGVAHAIAENIAAVNLITSLPFSNGKVGVIGHSMGGYNGLFLASFDKRVHAVVCSCGLSTFAHYGEWWRKRKPKENKIGLEQWAFDANLPRLKDSPYNCDPTKVPFDFPDLLTLIAPRPLMVFAADNDYIFDKDGARACIEAVAPYYRASRLYYKTAPCGHEFPPHIRSAAYQFLSAHLR